MKLFGGFRLLTGVLVLSAALFLGVRFNGHKDTVLRLALVIDGETEVHNDGAITDDLKHLIAQQASPILVIGGHVFDNIVQGYRHCRSGVWNGKRGIDLNPLIKKTQKIRRYLYQQPAGWQETVKRELARAQAMHEQLLNRAGNKRQVLYDDLISFFTLCKVGAPDHGQCFDRNWIVYRLNKEHLPVGYLMIPRRVLESMCSVSLAGGKQETLDDVIQELCNQRMIRNNNGTCCTTLTDVINICGLNKICPGCEVTRVYVDDHGDHKGLVSGRYEGREIDKKELARIVRACVRDIVRPATHHQTWCVKVCGHGGTVAAGYAHDMMAGMEVNDFVGLIKHVLTPKGTGLVTINSCYAGGANRMYMKELVSQLREQGTPMAVVLESSTDATTLNISPSMLTTEELDLVSTKTNVMDDATSLSTWNALPYVSLPRCDQLFDSLENRLHQGTVGAADVAAAYQSFILSAESNDNEDDLEVLPSNLPQVIDAKAHCQPLCVDNHVQVIDHQEPTCVSNRTVLWVKERTMSSPIILDGSVPYLLSGKAHEMEHIFECIDARACPDVEDVQDFVEKFFIHDGVRLATSRSFVIKKLLLSTGSFCNISGKHMPGAIILHWQKNPNKDVSWTYKFDKEKGWYQCSEKALSASKRTAVREFVALHQKSCSFLQ